VSSNPDAAGIARAERAAIPVAVIQNEAEVIGYLAEHEVGLVVLAGYMRIVSPAFLELFPRTINVHPSLLPAFPGRTAIADALAHGVRITGVTVHWVDVGVDTGPIIVQEAVAVSYDDHPLELEQRIHQVEHRLLTQTVRQIVAGEQRL
jgi:phosphoribosylglycinamide formyltransferase 1